MERIDVHVHCVPPAYREYCLRNEFAGFGRPDGMPRLPEWNATAHIQLMRELNIRKSILSISSPGTHLTPGNDEEARELTRRTNIEMAEICSTHPHQFDFFASLPLPDIEGSLEEIDYALDTLGAVGFQILTNSHGVYPGDTRLQPIFDHLDRRKAVIFLHPTTCHLQNQSGAVTAVTPQPSLPRPMLEFMFDSTRAITGLLTSKTMSRCPHITILACHCGATLPPILERIVEISKVLLGSTMTSEEAKSILQTRFYFDLAGLPVPDQIHGILRLVDYTRLLFGTDYPFTPSDLAKSWTGRLDNGINKVLQPDVQRHIMSDNAQNVFQFKLIQNGH